MGVPAGTALWHAEGCAECGFSGYRGRTGIHELLRVDDRVRMAIHRGENELTLGQRLGADYITLRRAGLEKVLSGITSWEEVVRVTEQHAAQGDQDGHF
jgi:general secretion pathway protein E